MNGVSHSACVGGIRYRVIMSKPVGTMDKHHFVKLVTDFAPFIACQTELDCLVSSVVVQEQDLWKGHLNPILRQRRVFLLEK